MSYPSYTYPVAVLHAGSSLGSAHAFVQLDPLTNVAGLWCSLDNQFYLGGWDCECSTGGETLRAVETEFLPESQMTVFEARDVTVRKRFFIPAFDEETKELDAAVLVLTCSNGSDDERALVVSHALTLTAAASPLFTKKPPEDQTRKRHTVQLFQNRCEIETLGRRNEASLFTSSLRWRQCRVDDDGNIVAAEYEHVLPGRSESELAFFFFFSPFGKDGLPEFLPDHIDLLTRSRAWYRRLLGRSSVITPDAAINRGLQWAAVNTARVQHRYRSGWAFTNDPPQDIIVLRDCAWYLFGSDYCTPEFSRRLIECCLACGIHENGKVTEFFHADEEHPILNDYQLNINDDTPLFVCGMYHYALAQGGKEFLQDVYGVMKRACDWILSQREDGLVVCTAEGENVWGICSWRNIIDHYNLAGAVTEINAECVHALHVTSQAAELLGETSDAERYRMEAAALKEAINTRLVSRSSGLYLLHRDRQGVAHGDITGDLIFPVLFNVPDVTRRKNILTRLTAADLWTPFGSRTVSPSEHNYDPDFGYQLVGGVWPNLTAWVAYCIREEEPGRLVEGMRNIYRLSDFDRPKKYGNVVPGEFPERLHGETFESRGMAMSPWMPPTYLWLGVEGLFGVKPTFAGLEVEPAMPEEWEWLAVKNLQYRGSSVSMFVHQGILYAGADVKSTYAVRRGIEAKAAAEDPDMTVIAITMDDCTALFAHADRDTGSDVSVDTPKGTIMQHVELKAHTAKVILLWMLLLCFVGAGGVQAADRIAFAKKYGQVEAGGPFAGAEFHGSRPLPSRISLYYPVANSIDLSTGYWERGQSAPFSFGLRRGSGPVVLPGTEGWEYVLSPHTVVFTKAAGGVSYSIRYQFCVTQPAMAVTYKITNTSANTERYEALTQAALTLRTCQTYARKERAVMRHVKQAGAVVARFNAPDTDSTSVFIINAGEAPSATMLDTVVLPGKQSAGGKKGPLCAFKYVKDVPPGDSLVIVQVIGSCRNREADAVLEQVKAQWQSDIEAYDTYVHLKISQCRIVTGDTALDRSVGWAAAMLASNRHYINGTIVPMPCPAEYNFFFTHDVLLTDLGAVHFDRDRVKRDLSYIVSLARDSVIPHAYYWRDDGMKTEFCAPDNWNHLWFILASASYVRHTQDDSAARLLFPFVKKSLGLILTQKKADGLLYAKHPDWWDIGNIEGPRAYITALTVRAIGEYCYLAARQGEQSAALRALDETAHTMRRVLVERLWDPEAQYLMNFNGTAKDRHIYAGSLVAGAYGVLDRELSLQMAEAARRAIVDPKLGVRTVSPTDFHLDSVIRYYRLAGKEAGEPFVYANGGIWPHTTAWYIWVLDAAGKKDEAAAFLKRTLAIDGIIASPMGQPAMFEYRFADPASPRYGEIDKPTFMWAGGFFLQSLYRLYGISDNEWNISFSGMPSGTRKEARFPFVFAEMKPDTGTPTDASLIIGRYSTVVSSGQGAFIERLRLKGRDVPSAVLPLDAASDRDTIEIRYGACRAPYLERINAVLHRAVQKNDYAEFTVSSFEGHKTQARFICPAAPKRITIDGVNVSAAQHTADGAIAVEISYTATAGRQMLQLFY